MPAADISPSPTTPPPDTTLVVALAIVAIFGALEIAGVAVHYVSRARDNYKTSHPTAPAPAVVAPPKTNATTTNTVTTTAAPAQVSNAPAPAESKAGTNTTVLSTAERMLKEANALRDKGDTTSALARLQEAAQRDPKNAEVLATMGMIYESIQLFERSNESWNKLHDLGPSAGTYYELADMKLKGGVPASGTNPTSLSNSAAQDTGSAHGSEPAATSDGSTLGITELKVTDVPDPDAETNMKLRIAVKARANTAIDHTKVKIQVYFYDTLDNKDREIILTDADVSYEWLTPHHDWKDTDTEVLSVTYMRPKNKLLSETAIANAASQVTPPAGKKKGSKKESAEPPAEEGHRTYLGYIVRVYYSDQLQAVRADPSKLLTLFPPPTTAPQ